MRRPTLSTLAGIGLLLLAIALAARGAAPVAAERLPQIATPRSAHIALEMSLGGTDTDTGETFELTARGEGDIDTVRPATQFTCDLRLPAGLPGDPLPESVTVAIVMVDGRLYLRDREAQGWTWMALPPGSTTDQFAPDFNTWNAAWGTDAPDFTRVGPEQLNGAATTHWRAAYDFADLLLADPDLAPTPSAAPLPRMIMAVDLWIGDADGYVHRMTAGMEFSGTDEDGRASSFTMSMALTYSKFDQPVSIVAPDGAVPADTSSGANSSNGLFPSLSGLPLDGSTFALPGGGGTIAGSFPGIGGSAIGRPGGPAPSPAPGQSRGGIVVATVGPTASAKPDPQRQVPPTPTRAATIPPTAPPPTATVAVVANAVIPPTAAAQPQAAVAPAAQAPPQAPAARSNSRMLALGMAGLIVLLGLAAALIVAGRRQARR